MITHLEAAAVRVASECDIAECRERDLVDGYEDLVPTHNGLAVLKEYDERVAYLLRQLDCLADDLPPQACANQEDVLSELRKLLGVK